MERKHLPTIPPMNAKAKRHGKHLRRRIPAFHSRLALRRWRKRKLCNLPNKTGSGIRNLLLCPRAYGMAELDAMIVPFRPQHGFRVAIEQSITGPCLCFR